MATYFDQFVKKETAKQSLAPSKVDNQIKKTGNLISFDPKSPIVQEQMQKNISSARSIINVVSGGSKLSIVPDKIVKVEQSKLDKIFSPGTYIYPQGSSDTSGLKINTGLDTLSSGDGNKSGINRDLITIKDKETIIKTQETITKIIETPGNIISGVKEFGSGIDSTISKYAIYALVGLGLFLAIQVTK